MNRAENETPETAPDDVDAREDKQERRSYWRRVRRRVLGAAAVFLLIGMLWQLGDDSRPPRIAPAAPSAEEFPELAVNPVLRDAAAELESAEEFTPAPEPEQVLYGDFAADAEESAEPPPEISDAAQTPPPEETAETAPSEETPPPEQSANESTADSETTPPPEETSPAVDADSSSSVADDSSLFFEISQLSGFSVQLGAFVERKLALRLARKLQNAGFTIKILPLRLEDNLLFRVRAVGYSSRAEAELARRDLVALGYSEAAVRDLR
ncbi:MAG: SPOR domain-containing protein [Gammaproteobacteria bacterium]